MNPLLKKKASTLDEFTNSYIEAALWTTDDDNGDSLGNHYNSDDLSTATLAKMKQDCAEFLLAMEAIRRFRNQNTLERAECRRGGGGYSKAEQAGHDFWLTRNGHGAGFWDGDWGDSGEDLTAAAKWFGEADLYVGDDGLIYQAGSEDKEEGGTPPPFDPHQIDDIDKMELQSMGIVGNKKAKKATASDYLLVDEKTGEEIPIGTIRKSFRDEDYKVLSFTPPRHAGSNGKVYVEAVHSDDQPVWQQEFFPGVIGAKIILNNRFNEVDMAELKSMGIQGSKKSSFLVESEVRELGRKYIAECKEKGIDPWTGTKNASKNGRKFDYEADGSNVTLLSYQQGGQVDTRFLDKTQAEEFWVALDNVEESFDVNDVNSPAFDEVGYRKAVDHVISRYFENQDEEGSVPQPRKANGLNGPNYAEREKQVADNPTLEQCADSGRTHRNYGWAAAPWGNWTEEQKEAYRRGYLESPKKATLVAVTSSRFKKAGEHQYTRLTRLLDSGKMYVSAVEYSKDGRKVEKFTFTGNSQKAKVFEYAAAQNFSKQAGDFGMNASLEAKL